MVLPTYNEYDNLADLVRQILTIGIVTYVIVVDDNSPDGTGKLADALARNNGQVRVIHRSGKLGLGTAYIAGFRLALAENADRVVTMDADFSHKPRYLPAVVNLTKRYHVGIGSRYIAGGGVSRDWGWRRQLLSRISNCQEWPAQCSAWMSATVLPDFGVTGAMCYRESVLPKSK